MSINGTLIAQAIVFALLVAFMMKFVWPPLVTAIDARRDIIKGALDSADNAKLELAAANKRVESELAASRGDAAARLADAERRAQQTVEEAKARASEEGAKIVAAAKAEAQAQSMQVREQLREQVAALAVKGAEQILSREVNASVHADLLAQLKKEL
jgi:F-type H+-transporting ATPase subunit b